MPFSTVMERVFSKECIAAQQRQNETDIMFSEVSRFDWRFDWRLSSKALTRLAF